MSAARPVPEQTTTGIWWLRDTMASLIASVPPSKITNTTGIPNPPAKKIIQNLVQHQENYMLAILITITLNFSISCKNIKVPLTHKFLRLSLNLFIWNKIVKILKRGKTYKIILIKLKQGKIYNKILFLPSVGFETFCSNDARNSDAPL